jgi:hypothetical protein
MKCVGEVEWAYKLFLEDGSSVETQIAQIYRAGDVTLVVKTPLNTKSETKEFSGFQFREFRNNFHTRNTLAWEYQTFYEIKIKLK